jgi:predicted ATPase/DNA-binding SARP family transcriptional activator
MQRRLLAVLTTSAGVPCASDMVIEGLWETSPPASAAKLLQVYVSQLRKLLPAGIAIRSRDRGYLLEVADGALDAAEFERLLQDGCAAGEDGNPALAASLCRRALALWRGRAYGELAYCEFARAEADRLEELRLACLEERFEAELALGRHAQLLAELERAAAAQPLRERLQAQAMLALYRCGRQSDALEYYGATRARLRDELGLEPGPQLSELQRRILRHDPELSAPASQAPERLDTLPVPPNALLGRGRELAELHELLLQERARLLVLTGAGGSGKTRLAIAAAREAASSFANGAVFVDLAPLRDPELVPVTIASRLGIREIGDDPFATLADALRPQQLLLVLDNAEHLRAAAPGYAELLTQAPHLTLLVTSRAVLHLSGEHVYPVEPLQAGAAAELFRTRAREAEPRLQLGSADEAAVATICERLDGLPLAIELAAAHIRTLTPSELVARLEPRLPLLTGGPRDLPARQQTLAATLEWSYQLLDEAVQRDLRRLAIFAGGCTLEAAERVVASTLDRLAALVDHNLVHRTSNELGSRYTMLETIREDALQRLAAAETTELRDDHADYFVELAERAYARRLDQPECWLPLLEQEHANFRAALDWLGENDPQLALRLAGALGWFWAFRGHFLEGRRRLSEALARTRHADAIRARALAMGAQLVGGGQGDLETARTWGEEAATIARTLDEPELAAVSLHILGTICIQQDELAHARALNEEGLTYARRSDNGELEIRFLMSVCYILVCGRQPDLAEPRARELLARARETHSRIGEMFAHHYLGDCALQRRDCAAAEPHYRDALAIAWRLGHTDQAATELIGLAMALAGQGKNRQALSLAAAVNAHRAAQAVLPHVPFWEELQDHYFNQARANLGEPAATQAAHEGQATPIEQTTTQILDRPNARPPSNVAAR